MKIFLRNSRSRVIIPLLLALLLTGTAFLLNTRSGNSGNDKRKKYEAFLSSLNKRAPQVSKAGKEDEGAADEPGIAAYHDFLMTLDPATGTVPRERLIPAMIQTRNSADLKQSSSIHWQGYPSDMGGRTRAIMYDPNDATHKKVWAGGVTGGLWYNNDITSATSPWIPVGDFWSNLAIRCLTYDPAHPQTFYIGTGEAETAMETYRESSGLGTGIMRSTDGGQTWGFISGTEQFAYVTKIVIRIENGISVIYAGVASGLYKGEQHQSLPSDGLFRSADNGVTWQQVLPLIQGSTVPYCVSDIALGADNRLYVGTRPNLNGEGAAVLLYSTNGTTWTVNSQYQTAIINSTTNTIPGRVVLAAAPSDPNIVYALIADGFVNSANGFNYYYCDYILRSADKGVTWVTKAVPTDLTSGTSFATIAWHALDIAVDPNNADHLYIGGLDVHHSTNGGNSWTRVSDWSLMYSGGGPMYIHADQHIIVYKPGSSDELVLGCDGGIFYTANGSLLSPDFEQHGASATPEFFARVVEFAKRHRLVVIHDAAYAALVFEGRPLSFLATPGAMEVGIELHSASKSFNMTGWRCGFVAGNELLVRAYGDVKDNTDSGQFLAIQHAAAHGLDHPEITEAIAAKYSRRMDALVAVLARCGFQARKPKGSFFLYVKAPKAAVGKDGVRVTFQSAEEVSQWLITEKLISSVPWDDVGAYLRFSVTFAAKTVADESRVMGEVADRLGDVRFEF